MIHGIDVKARPFYLNETQETWVRESLESMSLKEKAGQLFCLMAFPEKLEEHKAAIREYSIGGLRYGPMCSKEELKQQFAELDAVAKYPLLKAANLEEGGNGAARDGFRFSTQMGAAATGRLEDVTHLAYTCAKEAAEVGINWAYSPVADIDRNFLNPITNVRSYGADVNKVVESTGEYVRVMQSAGIAACAKHFPGDGVDFRSQHLLPTVNSLPAEEWYRTYGAVYKSLIDHDLMTIMAGHIAQPMVQKDINPDMKPEDTLPGSMCKELLSGVLREKYGFNGVISTDATIMNGYNMAMEREKALPLSIEAGCDMFCFCMDLKEDVGYVLAGLETGLLTMERLNQAVTRILALKAKVATEKPVELPEAPIREWARACADHGVTLVKDVKDILPVKKERYDKILLSCLDDDGSPDGSLKDMMVAALEKEGIPVELYDPAVDELRGPASMDKRVLTIYVSNMEAKINNTANRLYWHARHGLGTPRFAKELDYIYISFGNPYHLMDVPRVPVYINAYTSSRIVVDAVVDKLFGGSEFKGISPVDPFCGLMDTRL